MEMCMQMEEKSLKTGKKKVLDEQACSLKPADKVANKNIINNLTEGSSAEKVTGNNASLKTENFDEVMESIILNMNALSLDDKIKEKKLKAEDFVMCRQIGRGQFGRIFLSYYRSTKKYYALKTLNLEHALKKMSYYYIEQEFAEMLSL
ncbi:hypothetical protein T11_5317 [Trichinella zimbabwensis]|uniref:Protein kinase domain-containing protein n=1 Tax=Trichinella zimbabwensis TaxID=268475 RepID=A0A0V1HN18_9BILA|nr:hypothetical protein T11_5317 [Trichinella zimbabwensis]